MNEMFITPIQLTQIGAVGETGENTRKVSGQDGASLFKSIFKSAIDDVRATDETLNEAEYLLATGQLDNPAALTTAAAEATLAVDLLVQLRNKAQEAYTQLMNINV